MAAWLLAAGGVRIEVVQVGLGLRAGSVQGSAAQAHAQPTCRGWSCARGCADGGRAARSAA